MSDELIDIYDSDMNLLGTALKSQAHREGLWHKTAFCWILDGNQVWFQLRPQNAPYHPNLLGVSVFSHISTGETAKQQLIETFEDDLGLNVDTKEFEKLFIYRLVEDKKSSFNHSFCQVYALQSRWKLKEAVAKAENIAGLFAAPISDVIALFENEQSEITLHGCLKGSKQISKLKVGLKDFVPHDRNFYLKIFSVLERMSE